MTIIGYHRLKKHYPDRNKEDYQPNSLDLRLGRILHPTNNQKQEVGLYKDNTKILPDLIPQIPRKTDNTYLIEPNTLVYAEVTPKMTIPSDIMQTYRLRSSLMRMGLTMTSCVGDSGFHGHLIFSLYNPTPYPIRITQGERFATAINHTTQEANEYNGTYQE